MGYGYEYEYIPVTRKGWECDKSLIPVGFGYEDVDKFFYEDECEIAKHVPVSPYCHH